MSVIFLTSQDFELVRNADGTGTVLAHNISGLSLVLFYSTSCPHCNSLLPIFRQKLPKVVAGCRFAMVNVATNNMELVSRSQGTDFPIEVVPHIVIYVDGYPYHAYDTQWPRSEEHLKQYIAEIASQLTARKFDARPPAQPANNRAESSGDTCKKKIPAFSIAFTCDPSNDVCYLNLPNNPLKGQES